MVVMTTATMLMMRRAQAALNLSSPTSVCGSLNTAIRQGITLELNLWINFSLVFVSAIE